ncbi:putative porphyrin biosynthetic protein [Vibrio maritimus]|uniref:Putative porphyrin biosynthetic protein n=1 Tax=Vibrio maritimus TaxID=990268 RepID=A0A090S8E8_9VIBR|nr:putative porphyrin biosynthetic protein [Vibrio maritimus]
MKYGWVYLADEYDMGHPQSMMVYQPVLEGKALIIKEAPADSEWRMIQPHPNFRFVATGNTNMAADETGIYQGTNIQNGANAERFGVVEQIPFMPKKQETQVVSAQGGISTDDAQRLVDFAAKVRDAYDAKKIRTPIGLVSSSTLRRSPLRERPL